MTVVASGGERIVDLIWSRSLEMIVKGPVPPPVRPSIGDELDAFIPQVATGLLVGTSPAFARVLYSAARQSAQRNSFFVMRRLGMPSDFFWKFHMWSDEKARSTVEKVVDRVFGALLNAGGQGRLSVASVDVPGARFHLEFEDSAECYAVQSERPACFFHAGTFAGIFSSMVNEELDCAEQQCRSAGSAKCAFSVGRPRDREVASQLERNLERPRVWVDSDIPLLPGPDSVRRLVNVGYYQLLLASAIVGNLAALERACLNTGLEVGNRLADAIENSGGLSESAIVTMYRDIRYIDLSIDSSGGEIRVGAIGTPELAGPLAGAAFAPFLAGELQSLLGRAVKPVRYTGAEAAGEKLVLVFSPEV